MVWSDIWTIDFTEVIGASFIAREIVPAELKIVPIQSWEIEILETMTYDSKLSKIKEVQWAFKYKEEADQETK